MQVNCVSNVRDISVEWGEWYNVPHLTKSLIARKLVDKGVNEWKRIAATELTAVRIH